MKATKTAPIATQTNLAEYDVIDSLTVEANDIVLLGYSILWNSEDEHETENAGIHLRIATGPADENNVELYPIKAAANSAGEFPIIGNIVVKAGTTVKLLSESTFAGFIAFNFIYADA